MRRTLLLACLFALSLSLAATAADMQIRVGNTRQFLIDGGGVVRDLDGRRVGSIAPNGTVRDAFGSFMGSVASDGMIRNVVGDYLGEVARDGVITRNGENWGVIARDGTIRAGDRPFWGTVQGASGYDDVRKITAVLVFFSQSDYDYPRPGVPIGPQHQIE